MSIFTLEEIKAVQGKYKFFKLVKDGVCEFDSFEHEIEKTTSYLSELRTVYAYFDLVANLHSLPHTKFKDITPNKEVVKEYEFKTKHLRIYAIHEKETGKVIICAGKKNSQESDIKHFRAIKKSYLSFLTNKKI